MKIQITEGQGKNVEGYNNIHITHSAGSLPQIVDHSCEEVVLNNSLSKLARQESLEVLQLACSRLRLGGKIAIYDVDVKSLCRKYVNKEIDQTEMSKELLDLTNCIEINEVRNILKQHGSVLESCGIKGYQYEIIGHRKNT
jgi:predicted SAM-dependent methyltransferase